MRASDISQERRLHEINQIRDPERIARILRASIRAAESSSNYRAFCAQFDGSYSFYHGDQWLNTDGTRSEAPPWRFRTIRNITFGMVHSIVSLMMDMRPEPWVVADFPNQVVPNAGFLPFQSLQGGGTEFRERTHADLASDATKMIQAEMDRTDEVAHMKNLLLDMTIGGLAIEKTYWNSKTERPAVRQIDPRDFLIDPECLSNNIYDGNASFVVWRKKMDADRMRRVYKLSKQATKRVIEESAVHEEASVIDDEGLYKQYEFASVFKDPHPDTADYNRPLVTVYEFWYFEDAVPGLERTEEPIDPSEFPKGRRIHLAGDTILLDDANPFPHGELPFVLYRNYGDPRDPYAFGDVEVVRGQQVALNVLQSQAMQMAILMANGQWVFEEGALREDWLSNRPGLAIEVPRGMVNSVKKLEGVNVPSSIFNLMDQIERNVEQVTNVNETMEGISPGTHISGEHVKSLQDAAFKRLRAKLSDVGMGRRRSVYQRFRMMQTWGHFIDVRQSGDMTGGEWMAWDDAVREMPVDIRIRSTVDEPTSKRERLEHATAMTNSGWFDPLQAVKFAELDVDDDWIRTLELTRSTQLRALHVQDMKMEIEELTVQQQRDQMLGAPGGQQPPRILDQQAVPVGPADQEAPVALPPDGGAQPPI
ncbi:MAG: hypothetical protein HN396_10795 [Gemmatimonadales bacterium]|jgi:hypothetical protein|nr:hypothetical protein [Gemmatimonadales bacterium]